jgi:hypothetical protein
VREVLADAKTCNTEPQKLLYALLITLRMLRHYFEAHKIVVLSSFPLGEIIRNRDANGCIIKWSVELGEFEFCPSSLRSSATATPMAASSSGWPMPMEVL